MKKKRHTMEVILYTKIYSRFMICVIVFRQTNSIDIRITVEIPFFLLVCP